MTLGAETPDRTDAGAPTDRADGPLATQLAQTVVDMTWDQIPGRVRVVAAEHLLDAIGLALASTTMDYGRAIHDAVCRLDGSAGSGTARVLGFGTRLTPAYAALANGTLIHGLDFDDTHIGAIYHATAPAAAAALAVGEEVDATGEDVLLAFIVGLEVGCRLAQAGAGHFHLRGFHPTGIIGTFAAACVAAKLRGTTAAELQSALGLCGSQAAGVLELNDSWLKRMHPGWAAHAGICAVTLAQAGFIGPATVFEGDGGVFAAHIGTKPSSDDLGLADLGQQWRTLEIALKPYPCCHFTHSFVDAAAEILDELGQDRIRPEDVETITCVAPEMIIPMVCEPRERKAAPPTIYDALFSVPFVTAARLLGRTLDLAMFYDEPLDDPQTLDLAAKVTCESDPNTDFPWHFPGTVSVTLRSGRTITRDVADSRGTKEHPLSRTDILAKFHSVAARTADTETRERLVSIVLDLPGRRLSELISTAAIPEHDADLETA